MNITHYTLSSAFLTIFFINTIKASTPASPAMPSKQLALGVLITDGVAVTPLPHQANQHSHSSNSGTITPQLQSASHSRVGSIGQPAQQPVHSATDLARAAVMATVKKNEKFAIEVDERAAANRANRKKLFSASRTASTVATRSVAKSPGLRVRSASIQAPALSPAFAASINASGVANRQARRRRRPLSMADIPSLQTANKNPMPASAQTPFSTADVSDQRVGTRRQSLVTHGIPGIQQTISVNAGQAHITINNHAAPAPAPAGCCVIL